MAKFEERWLNIAPAYYGSSLGSKPENKVGDISKGVAKKYTKKWMRYSRVVRASDS